MKSFGVHRMLDGIVVRRHHSSLDVGVVERALEFLRLGDYRIPPSGLAFLEDNPKEAHEAFAILTEEWASLPRTQY